MQFRWFLALTLVWCGANAIAQTADAYVGKYVTQRDQSVVEILREGPDLVAKQIDSPNAKNRQNNGKLFAKNLAIVDGRLVGEVIDFTSHKQYKASWEKGGNGDKLTMKVKWGFLTFSDTWRKL